jgi:hypothetical protein
MPKKKGNKNKKGAKKVPVPPDHDLFGKKTFRGVEKLNTDPDFERDGDFASDSEPDETDSLFGVGNNDLPMNALRMEDILMEDSFRPPE